MSTLRRCLPTLTVAAWILWSYGYPQPSWKIMGHYATQAACQVRADMMGPAYVVRAGPLWEIRCYPVGVDPARVHPLYEWLMALPEAPE